jgi:hypothetical protein
MWVERGASPKSHWVIRAELVIGDEGPQQIRVSAPPLRLSDAWVASNPYENGRNFTNFLGEQVQKWAKERRIPRLGRAPKKETIERA